MANSKGGKMKHIVIMMMVIGIFLPILLSAKDKKYDIINADPILFDDFYTLVLNDHSLTTKLCLVKIKTDQSADSEYYKIIDYRSPFDKRTSHKTNHISDRGLLLKLIKLPDTLKVDIKAKARGNFSWDRYFSYKYKGIIRLKYVDVKRKKLLLPCYYTPDIIYNKDGFVYK
jgi:hypothetical protein